MTEAELSAQDRTKEKTYEIVINGSLYPIGDQTVTYEQVVDLAFPGRDPNVLFSVVYRKAEGGHGGSGTLVAGASAAVKKKGTSFDVTPTTRS